MCVIKCDDFIHFSYMNIFIKITKMIPLELCLLYPQICSNMVKSLTKKTKQNKILEVLFYFKKVISDIGMFEQGPES